MENCSAFILLIAFTFHTMAIRETLALNTSGKSTLSAERRVSPFEDRILNKNNEEQPWRKSDDDANEFKQDTNVFLEKTAREKRSRYYWYGNQLRKKKFRPSPLIWG